MFHYFLAFLLINTCYQSLGNPIDPSPPQQSLAKSLATLATQCKNTALAPHIINQVKECNLSISPSSKKQFQCLIFYDINMQLCSAMTSSKLTVSQEFFDKVEEKQDVVALCTLAKDWVFTNMSDFIKYKDSAEYYFKNLVTCGEVCSDEQIMDEANYYCKYYKMGLDLLKSQVTPTAANNTNNVVAPVISEPSNNADIDIPVPPNSDPVKPQETNTITTGGQTAGSAVAKATPQKADNVVEDTVVKSETVAQVTSKQTPSIDNADKDNSDDADVNVRQEDLVVPAPDNIVPHNDQGNKTISVGQAEKPVAVNEEEVPELSPNSEQKQVAVIENPKPKAADADEYADPDGSEPDDENEDPGQDLKQDQENVNQETVMKNKLVESVHPHEPEVSKELFPNSIADGYSEDENDHFFPFFLTSIVLMVLLYVLYHNKSKVSKVFFGLILEGRQSGRRRNSRGHAYRRLDTLEQAMSANTAAPPSKIIY